MHARVRPVFPRAAALIAAAGLAFAVGGPVISSLAAKEQRAAPIRPPQTAPRLTFDQLVYEGAFRVPASGFGDTFAFGGRPMAFNPESNTLFLGSRAGKVAELSIPTPINASTPDRLPFAQFVQPFHDPADGRLKEVAEEGAALDGLMVHEGSLYGTGLIYYDALHAQRLTHFTRSLKLGSPEVTHMHRVGESGQAGFVAGYMASVPIEWRASLGGSAVTGQCCIPIAGRTSWGPSLFSWNPADLGRGTAVKAHPLVYYSSEHPTLGPWEGSNEMYGGTTEMAGVAIITGTRTVLFVGRNGTGPFCYGDGTSDPLKARSRDADGRQWCYDPVNSDKAPHAYPYRLQFWAYDLNDLAAVRAGSRDPWEVKPYAVWPFELPIDEPRKRVGSVAFDPARRRLFISQLQGDPDGYEFRPLIHVFRIS